MPSRHSRGSHPNAASSRRDSARSRRDRRGKRRRRVLVVVLLLFVVLAGAELVRRGITVDIRPPAVPTGEAVATPPPEPTAAVTPSSAPTAPASPTTPLLAAPGGYPRSGPATWGYGGTQGNILGTAGTLRRFRIAIETGVEELGFGTDFTSFATMVDATLGDPKSWIGGRQVRFQRVPNGASHEFTIHLATGETARAMCAAGGVDIRVGGVPYTSCRTTGRVIVNLSRWMSSVPELIGKGVPLDAYRQYVINHEVGHQLGYNHERCPRPGQPAPVMQKQTLGLDGCVFNQWPYLNGRRYAGPPL